MSKINIQGTVDNIRSKSNVYTPLIEAIVNSIDSIIEAKQVKGEVIIKVIRENSLQFDDSLSEIKSIEIHDNGIGFRQKNRDSFDTLYSLSKKLSGGKGFGRFMYLKYFSDVKVHSIYKEDDGTYNERSFTFGREDEIIVNEAIKPINKTENSTTVFLNNLVKERNYDKELETISRKLLERLLIFFINDKFTCPQITLQEFDGSKKIILNNYLSSDNEIKLINTGKFGVKSQRTGLEENFVLKVFKIYYSKTDSKVILTAHNREVVESMLHNYVPEFIDEFYDEIVKGEKKTKKNYSIKAYVLGDYLDLNVSLERETFNFDKDTSDLMYGISQIEIEKSAALKTKEVFADDVKHRIEKKKSRIYSYVNSTAPWHKTYINSVDLSLFSYNATDEKIELDLQKFKFQQEQDTKKDIQFILNSSDQADINQDINAILSKVTDIGKSDLAHYVCNRKIILDFFDALRKRDEGGNPNLEKEIHSLIFPMNSDTQKTPYEEHNLWLLDERLVFSEYVASDRKISKRKDAFGEPDLLIFDSKKSFRSGDNEYSNPITIFEFKRPKRDTYKQEDDPILQIGEYIEKIRAGKYEMPEGIEPIKVNDNTPVYAYVIADITDKIKQFAKQHSLTTSPDDEGYFGYHVGYKMYIEVISFKKLMKDAKLRNKIFFKKLQLE